MQQKYGFADSYISFFFPRAKKIPVRLRPLHRSPSGAVRPPAAPATRNKRKLVSWVGARSSYGVLRSAVQGDLRWR